MIGKVKSFDPLNGYGFITADGEDYIFRMKFRKGEVVEFEPTTGEKGKQATNIRKINK